MAFTTNYNLPDMPTGAVDWPALFNDFVNKIEAGRTIKITAGEALTAGQPFKISSDTKAYKAINTDICAGIVKSDIALDAEGFGYTGKGNIITTGAGWTVGGLIYVGTTAGTLTQTEPISTTIGVAPIAIAKTATSIMLLSGTISNTTGLLFSAALPAHYERDQKWQIKGYTVKGSITAFADSTTAPGVDTTVTSASHGLSNGEVVVITGTTSYNGTWTIENVTTDTFDIIIAFVADDATGTWQKEPARRYTLLSPNRLTVNIDDLGYALLIQSEIDLSAAASWDTQSPIDYTTGANVVSTPAFTGSGLDDMSLGADTNYAGPDIKNYRVEIYATGTPDTFKWSNDGGSTWEATGVAITGSAQLLENRIYVTFAATTGHTVGDYWDETATPGRAGKSFYIYACQPSSGLTPVFVISANSTVPSGYTADNSRKIGCFNCECADVGTISGHSLDGFVAGDILPASIADLKHRPKERWNEGMVYDESTQLWVDIYLASGTGSSAESVYNGTITDSRNWMDVVDDGAAVKKRMLRDREFQIAATGSNEETNINGSADAVTTGGHSDTAGRRMVSNIGCEDCCGVMWQWLDEQSFRVESDHSHTENQEASYTQSVQTESKDLAAWGWYNLPGSKGRLYRQGAYGDVKLLAGANWSNSSNSGSRARYAYSYRWFADTAVSGRFAADTGLRVKLLAGSISLA